MGSADRPRQRELRAALGAAGRGLPATLLAAGLAIVSSLVLGTGLAVLRVQLKALRPRRFNGRATPLRYGSSA
jgi:ABC-type amino acid transport system permease subunit